MARIEELIAEIGDLQIREAIAREVAELKKRKKFGLVFEEHIPEQLLLPSLPIRPGARVSKRGVSDTSSAFVVEELLGNGKALIRSENARSELETVSAKDIIVIKRFGEPIYPTLVPISRLVRDARKPYHTIINADNYHALQLLLYCYAGRVDVIYIDPPYNKKAKDWKYNNNYVDPSDQWRHSKWLAMMKKRLVLAKQLLRRDGILIVTIDENEVHHLGMLLEDVFPEYLRHMITTVINPKGTGKLNFARVDEYMIFCVPKTGTNLVSGNLVPFLSAPEDEAIEQQEGGEEPGDEGDEEEGEGNDADEVDAEQEDVSADSQAERPFPAEEAHLWELRHARRRGSESSYRHQRPHQFYPIYIDATSRRVSGVGQWLDPKEEPSMATVDGLVPVWPIDHEGNHRCWRFVPETMNKLIAEKRVIVGQFNSVRQTWTLNIWERKTKIKKVKTVWWRSRHDAGTHGTSLLHRIFGRRDAFSFPKSLYVVHDALAAVCGNRPDAIVVDFFAGSGTTYHATALLNAEDGGQRRCVLVTNNEVTSKLASRLKRQGLGPGDRGYDQHGICEAVAWPRCKMVTQGHREDGTPLEGRYLESGHRLSDGFAENIQYLRLDFLDPDDIAAGSMFEEILPVLWLMAGASGEFGVWEKEPAWLIAKESKFAVLLEDESFAAFKRRIADHSEIRLAFLVTDSEEAFREMSSALPIETRMLYKSYLENFRRSLEVKS